MPLSLGNIILLKEKGGMRESVSRQVDKKSGVPRGGERGLGFSWRRKRQTFFFFFFKPETQQTTQFELCTRDYIATMYPA